MAKILGIDSSGLVCSVAVVTEEQLLGEFTLNQKKTHSQTLLPLLSSLRELLELDLDTLDAIAVAYGPGSFTGLRIGSATAKGLADALEKPIVSVPTVDAIAYNLCGCGGLVCPVMDARRDQTYTGIYEFQGDRLITLLPQCAIPVQELVERLNRQNREVFFLGDGVPVFAETFRDTLKAPYFFAPQHMNRQRAASVATLGLKLFAEGKKESAAEHKPEYLRLSQAERERIARSGEAAFRIRPAEKRDIIQLCALEKEIFPLPWSEQAFTDALSDPNATFLTAVSEETGEVCAYVGMYTAADEGEITNVATAAKYRRQGLSYRLLLELRRIASEKRLTQLVLETRKSNDAAVALYRKAGFEIISERKGFYQFPPEDAYVMMLRCGYA